ncbi:phospholipase D-like domain-containing protein [bacterium]|nr:phospholipase D-like domain-containing protein [bacterium]
MRITKLLKVCAISLLINTSNIQAKGINVYFGPVEQGETRLDQHFIKFISKAKKTIDAAFYELRDENIMNALIEAHNAGVQVQLLVDSHHFFLRNRETLEFDYDKRNKFIQPLLDAGITVKEDNRRSGLMHNKFCILDGKHVWTGSYNLSDTGTYKNENNAIEVTSKKLAKVYTREFQEMYFDSAFGITSPSTIEDQKIKIGKTPVEVYFAPEDNPVGKIETEINNAQESVYFMQFAMTSDELGTAMINKRSEGLKVKGIFDRMLYRSTGPYAEFSRLTQNDVPVIVYDSPYGGKLHHKVFIIDAEGENPRVIFGSLNASKNGNKTNDENIIIIRDKRITQLYFDQFNKLFGRLSRVTAGFKSQRPLIIEQDIKRMTLMISTNGIPTDQLKIQFPARWGAINEEASVEIYRMIDGKQIKTTHQENLYITQRDIILRDLDLKRKGEDALLIIKCNNFKAPTIPGFYNMYIQAKSRTGKMYPLKFQPAIHVLDPENTEAIAQDKLTSTLLNKLYDGKYQSFFSLMSVCENDDQCGVLTQGSFIKRAIRIINQKILIHNEKDAKKVLKRLKLYQTLAQSKRIPKL